MHKTFDGNRFVFTNRTADEIITLKAGANEHLLLDGINFLKILATTESTSITSGSVVLTGGLGISMDTFIGGSINVHGTVSSASLETGPLVTNNFRTTALDPMNTLTNAGHLKAITSAITNLNVSGTHVLDYTGNGLGITDTVAWNQYYKTQISDVRCANLQGADVTLSGLQTWGSITLVAGNRVLVKDQSDFTENGIWVVASGAWTRPSDFNTGTLSYGKYCFVTTDNGEGLYSPAVWACTGNAVDETGLVDTNNNFWTLLCYTQTPVRVSGKTTVNTSLTPTPNFIVAGQIDLADGTDSSSTATGALRTYDGLYVRGSVQAFDYIAHSQTPDRIYKATAGTVGAGAIVTNGGIAVAKDLWCNNLYCESISSNWLSDRVWAFYNVIGTVVATQGDITPTGSLIDSSSSANSPTFSSSHTLSIHRDGLYTFVASYSLYTSTNGYNLTPRFIINGDTVCDGTTYISEASHQGVLIFSRICDSGDTFRVTSENDAASSYTINIHVNCYSNWFDE
jgi:hypothetical protein